MIRILLIVLIFCNLSKGQTKIGLEFRTSLNSTFNNSEILSGRYFILTDERNALTNSFSFGLFYDLNRFGVFKVHFGRHQNGRIIDGMSYFGHNGGNYDFFGIDAPAKYFQIVPSYAYSYSFGKSRIPLELGWAMNKLVNIEDLRFVGINSYNYDIRASLGYEYSIFKNASIGFNAIYSKALTNYSDEFFIDGKFEPYQFGLELSLKYAIFSFG